MRSPKSGMLQTSAGLADFRELAENTQYIIWNDFGQYMNFSFVLFSQGDAVFWYNMLRSGEGDFRTRHAGCPVVKGWKWGMYCLIGLIYDCTNVG